MTLSKYDELMNKIEVSEEMQERILKNIDKENFIESGKVQPFLRYKKLLSAAACIAVLLIGAVAVSHISKQTPVVPDSDALTIPGIVEAASAQELSDKAGFEIKDIASLAEQAKQTQYECYEGGLGQIQYELEWQSIIYRKSIGTDDNSGDYNAYDSIKEISVHSQNITIKGNGETYCLATWTDGEFSYSLSFSVSISEEEIKGLIQQVE